jgi:hypothetical protein
LENLGGHIIHNKWVVHHIGLRRLWVADGEDVLQIWRIAVADSRQGLTLNLGVGNKPNNSSLYGEKKKKKKELLPYVTKELQSESLRIKHHLGDLGVDGRIY